jgi:hypothetical protein
MVALVGLCFAVVGLVLAISGSTLGTFVFSGAALAISITFILKGRKKKGALRT